METFDPELLRSIESMDHGEAQVHCTSLITGSKTKAAKKAQLLRDIQSAPNSKELSRIMWNVMLAGEGLATTTSKWQATYGKAK